MIDRQPFRRQSQGFNSKTNSIELAIKAVWKQQQGVEEADVKLVLAPRIWKLPRWIGQSS